MGKYIIEIRILIRKRMKELKLELKHDIYYVTTIIKSCVTIPQLINACNYISILNNRYKKTGLNNSDKIKSLYDIINNHKQLIVDRNPDGYYILNNELNWNVSWDYKQQNKINL